MNTPFDSPLLPYQLHCEFLLISYSLHPSDPAFGTTQFFGTHFADKSSDFVAGGPGIAHPLGGDVVISPTVGATVTVSINSDDNFLVEYKIDFSGNVRKRSVVVPPGASVPFLLNAKPFELGATLSGRSAVLQGTFTATERESAVSLHL
ncbi:hypothetical protein [Mesorhizobium sp. M0589]|uniref:hypothetical protein n=1 Tax=Mesorhizobium sp. M0589 TaxID=2956965 RepID=UPI00333D9E9A